jgi:hypothetical protein
MVAYGNKPFRDPHTREYYDRLFFGPGDRTIAGYYIENSYNAFTWTSAGAGVVGPVRTPALLAVDQFRSEAIRLAGATGWRSDPLDTDGDGTVRGNELAIVTISSGPPPWEPLTDGETEPRAADWAQTNNMVCPVTPIGSTKPICIANGVSSVEAGI